MAPQAASTAPASVARHVSLQPTREPLDDTTTRQLSDLAARAARAVNVSVGLFLLISGVLGFVVTWIWSRSRFNNFTLLEKFLEVSTVAVIVGLVMLRDLFKKSYNPRLIPLGVSGATASPRAAWSIAFPFLRHRRSEGAPIALALMCAGIVFSMVVTAKIVWFHATAPWNDPVLLRTWLLFQSCYVLALLCLPFEETRAVGVGAACFTSAGYAVIQGGLTLLATALIGLALPKPSDIERLELLLLWIPVHLLVFFSSLRWIIRTDARRNYSFVWGIIPAFILALVMVAKLSS